MQRAPLPPVRAASDNRCVWCAQILLEVPETQLSLLHDERKRTVATGTLIVMSVRDPAGADKIFMSLGSEFHLVLVRAAEGLAAAPLHRAAGLNARFPRVRACQNRQVPCLRAAVRNYVFPRAAEGSWGLTLSDVTPSETLEGALGHCGRVHGLLTCGGARRQCLTSCWRRTRRSALPTWRRTMLWKWME